MKFNVKKTDDTITLKVKMSKKEYNSNEKIAFGRRQAKIYLKEKGYNVTENIKTGLVINHTSSKKSEDEFIFKLIEEKSVPKKASKTVNVGANVNTGKNIKKAAPTIKKVTTVPKKATKAASKKPTTKTFKKEA